MTLAAIQSLTLDDIREIITAAIRDGLASPVIEDFLTSVDWSGYREASALVRDVLGNLEEWATEYREGDLPIAEYAANLLSVLAQSESLRA